MGRIGKIAMIIGGLAAVAGLSYLGMTAKRPYPPGFDPKEVVAVSELSPDLRKGKVAYDKFCTRCHGDKGQGVEMKGPPLVISPYRPGSLSDPQIGRAIAFGVKSYRWDFGKMEPIPMLDPTQAPTEEDLRTKLHPNLIEPITAYVRAMQEANGITRHMPVD